VCGVSEAIVLSLFKPDVIVITGLGRLLMPKQKLRKAIFKILIIFYKNRNIITLNNSDFRIFKAIGFKNCFLINGEGVNLKYIQSIESLNEYPFETKLNFLYAGRLIKSKNVHKIINYFDLLFCEDIMRDKCNLILVGDDDYGSKDAVDSQILDEIKIKYPENVFRYGYQDEVISYMKSCNYFISLSCREGLPFSVVEALASGCFCILSDVPGHKEFKNIDGVSLIKNIEDFDRVIRESLYNYKNKSNPDLEKFSKEKISSEILNIFYKMNLQQTATKNLKIK
jgi:glycosyltransferase involved in cell wall biosynthesis